MLNTNNKIKVQSNEVEIMVYIKRSDQNAYEVWLA